MSTITRQGRAIERLLLKKGPRTARQIASELRIMPNAVYRSVRPLIRFGFVQENGKYPVRYEARNPAQGIGMYAEALRNDLIESLSEGKTNPSQSSQLNVSFIQNRNSLIKKSDADIARAKREICVIVSGLEVPPETTLAFKTAADQGVAVRMIVQNIDEVKKKRLTHWERMGIMIRHYPIIQARIIIIDSSVVYITSYNPREKEEAVGVRFSYAPVALIMKGFFNQEWRKSKPLTA